MSAPGPGQTLFRFVRHWSRRPPAGDQHLAEQGRLVLVAEAVNSLTQQGITATVNAIADEIGIDQSGASRLVSSAATARCLTLQPSPTDGRRRHATLTTTGHTLLEQAHDWQERVFDDLTKDWSEQRRKDLQRAMTELVDRSHTLNGFSAPASDPGHPDNPSIA